MGRVVATRREARSNSARSVELTGEVSNVPHARHLVAEDLRNTNVSPTVIENALIVVTELVTNAILHAQPLPLSGTRTGVVLQWAVLGDDVLIEVSDGGGSERPRVRQPRPPKTKAAGCPSSTPSPRVAGALRARPGDGARRRRPVELRHLTPSGSHPAAGTGYPRLS